MWVTYYIQRNVRRRFEMPQANVNNFFYSWNTSKSAQIHIQYVFAVGVFIIEILMKITCT